MTTKYSTVSDPQNTARAYGRDMPCSPKSGRNVAKALNGMPVGRAKEWLEAVADKKAAVPFLVRKRKIAHRRGQGFGPGKYPVKVAKHFLKVIESAEANAEYKGLDAESLVITHASAYQGQVQKAYTPRAYGRASPSFERTCNFEVIVTVTEEEA